MRRVSNHSPGAKTRLTSPTARGEECPRISPESYLGLATGFARCRGAGFFSGGRALTGSKPT